MGAATDRARLPEPGELLAGRYRVEGGLGHGGMGVVIAARDLELDRPVALKLLRGIPEEKGIVRLLREARAAASLTSEHAVAVFDVGQLEDGVPFIAMERLNGCDLGALLASQGPIAIDDAVDYVLQAAVAIAEAHVRGIVHRDLKPSNLFLARRADGSSLVKVLDFGVSKLPGAMADSSSGPRLTAASGVLGSPLYMAPEQALRARDADSRSDIWSMGAILYELLAGVPPFEGETVTEVLAAILKVEPRALAERRPDAPVLLCRLVHWCLHKDPLARPQTVAELVSALAPLAPARSRVCVERVAGLAARGAAPPEPAVAARPASSDAQSPAAYAPTIEAKVTRTFDPTEPGAAGGGPAVEPRGASGHDASVARRFPALLTAALAGAVAALVVVVAALVWNPRAGTSTAPEGAPAPTTTARSTSTAPPEEPVPAGGALDSIASPGDVLAAVARARRDELPEELLASELYFTRTRADLLLVGRDGALRGLTRYDNGRIVPYPAPVPETPLYPLRDIDFGRVPAMTSDALQRSRLRSPHVEYLRLSWLEGSELPQSAPYWHVHVVEELSQRWERHLYDTRGRHVLSDAH